MSAPRLLPCPHCGSLAPWHADNPWRPFCSERCKQIDLGGWLAKDAAEEEIDDDARETPA
jgi:endogenous inhibitor of DNA gyrase (YacG/DUF329 family)